MKVSAGQAFFILRKRGGKSHCPVIITVNNPYFAVRSKRNAAYQTELGFILAEYPSPSKQKLTILCETQHPETLWIGGA